MLFLVNDTLFDLDERCVLPPIDARRFDSLDLGYVIQLGQEMFAEEPMLARRAPDRAYRLATLLALKEPEMNAALFVAPVRGCKPSEVGARFAQISIEVMAALLAKQSDGALDPMTADREVWRRMAA